MCPTRKICSTALSHPTRCLWIKNLKTVLENLRVCSVICGSPGIAWEGDVPVGTCTASPCRVTNSDFAGGPYCRCLRGFYRAITWEGNQSKGQCLPAPQCSLEITHAASLATDVHDSRGKLCRAGEQLVSLHVLRNLYDNMLCFCFVRCKHVARL